MADNQGKRRETIESLLAERKKFEAWLAQLDAKRAATAEHVFARVHADYTTRLDDVLGRLGAEADGIRALAGELEARLATEQTSLTEKSDERAELELRAAVGEFSEKEWNSTRVKLDAAIADLRSKLDATAHELVEMKGTLDSVVAAPKVASTPVERPEDVPSPPPARKSTPFDELAFLKSVAGTPPTPVPSQPVRSSVPKASKVVEPEVVPALEPVPAEVPVVDAMPNRLPEPTVEPSVESTPAQDADREPEPTPEPTPEPARARASSKTPLESPALGAPTPRTSQAIRSLKCQECGTLNFPTEWYCERCGGELAAF